MDVGMADPQVQEQQAPPMINLHMDYLLSDGRAWVSEMLYGAKVPTLLPTYFNF